MKHAILLAALLATSAPAYAQALSGPDCSNAVRLDHADVAKGGVIIITGPCANSGPAREVVHTARPGEPMVTTVILRRQQNGGSQAKVINVDDAKYLNTSSQARIIRLR